MQDCIFCDIDLQEIYFKDSDLRRLCQVLSRDINVLYKNLIWSNVSRLVN